MVAALPLVVLGAGVVSAGFLGYLWPYRDRPGARFFILTIAAETTWILAYGLALLVFDPGLRALFEVPIWLGVNGIGVAFLAFALAYTGRGDLVRSPGMYALVGLQGLHTLVVATNPWHGIAWSDYAIEPVLGAATVSYAHTPWLAVNFTGIALTVGAGAVLLFDAFFSYGRLYRAQAAAIALSPVLPGLAFLVWLLEAPLAVSPPLNLTPLTFPLHLALVGYAFFRRNMFELSPAVRRASERTAIDDLASAVLVVDDEERVITVNREARRVFDLDGRDVLGGPVAAVHQALGTVTEVDSLSLVTDGGRREYAVSTAPLSGAGDRQVGHTIVCQDVTEAIEREQRLGVLNRVLRHNLRNDLTVVRGYIDLAAETVDDEAVTGYLERAGSSTDDVIALGEKARDIEATLSGDPEPGAVRLRPVLEELVAALAEGHPEAIVELDVPSDLALAGGEPRLRAVFGELIRNAVEHHPGGTPTVAVTLRDRGDGRATLTVVDDGPGIPDHEVEVLTADEETALEHGSGLGLWQVTWSVRALGGTCRFDADGSGTTVTLELPTAEPA